MALRKRLICASSALEECGAGVRFMVSRGDETLPAFVVRFDGSPRAYVNQCAHVGVELDWMEGEFFDSDRRHLICATHGATYAPGELAPDAGVRFLDYMRETGTRFE